MISLLPVLGILIKLIAIKIAINKAVKTVFYPFVIAGKIMKFIYKKVRRAL